MSRFLRRREGIAIAAAVVTIGVCGSTVAIAGHVLQVDPATVPVGFLAAHNTIDDVPVSSLARAAKPSGMTTYVQHIRLGAGGATPWHTHDGPVVVNVVKGSLTYEDAAANRCRRVVYGAGTGFVDPGFGKVHRVVAGADGAEAYATYLLPREAETHILPRPAPAECAG